MKFFDKVGMFLSGLCLVHCIFLPLIAFLLRSVLAAFEHDHSVAHQFLLGGVLLSVVFSFIPGYKTHRHIGPFALSIVGIILLTIAAIPHLAHEMFDHGVEIIVSIVGSSLLIGEHLLNHKLCKKCTHHSCNSEIE